VQLLLAGLSSVEAYRTANYSGASARASDMAKQPDLVARLEYIQKVALSQVYKESRQGLCAAVYDKSFGIAQAEEARVMALHLRRPQAAIQAVRFKARIAGLLKEAAPSFDMRLSEMSIEQLEMMRESFSRELTDVQRSIDDASSK
jgi:hypothetical protein